MDIKTLFEKFEERKTIIGNYQGHAIWWEDVKRIFDELKADVVKIPQDIADWIEFFKERGCTLQGSTNPEAHYGISILDEFEDKFSNISVPDILSWIFKNSETYAHAWIVGYNIIKETKYVVTDGNHLYFKGYQEDVDIVILADEQPGTMYYVKKFDTKEEAQKVADVLGWKVQEAE